MGEKRIKLPLSLALVLCSLGISVQAFIKVRSYRRSQERDFTQCSTVEVLISQSRKVLLLNAYQIKLGQTRWKRTKGLGKTTNKQKQKPKNPQKTTSFYFSLKLLECICLSESVADLFVTP